MEKWFVDKLHTIMKHNNYNEDAIDVENCDKQGVWTPCDLIAREYLNNGGGSSQGFLGITPSECIECYDYMKTIKQELIDKNMISETAWNNSHFTLWKNYDF